MSMRSPQMTNTYRFINKTAWLLPSADQHAGHRPFKKEARALEVVSQNMHEGSASDQLQSDLEKLFIVHAWFHITGPTPSVSQGQQEPYSNIVFHLYKQEDKSRNCIT